MSIICFHNPNEENGYLSNWYASDFTYKGIGFSSMEQFMMYQKAVCFGDKAIVSQNEELRTLLKETGNTILAECAVKNRIWGIGLSMKDPDV